MPDNQLKDKRRGQHSIQRAGSFNGTYVKKDKQDARNTKVSA